MSFAPEILADVPFGISNSISIQVYMQSYGSGIKMKFAILKKGLTSGTLVTNLVPYPVMLLLVIFLLLLFIFVLFVN